MSAFSTNQRRNNTGNHNRSNYPTSNHIIPHSVAPLPSFSGARNLRKSSSPRAYQWRASYSPNHTTYQAHATSLYFAPHQNRLPSSMHDGVPPKAWNGPNFHCQYNSVPNSGYSQNPGFEPLGRPIFSPRHGSPRLHGDRPRPTGLAPSFGQGRGRWSVPGASHNFAKIGGRGVGVRRHGSGRGKPMGPEQFFHESMIKDPWKDITAVVWSPVDAPMTSS